MTITPTSARRITKAFALLGSPVDGEALAAARAVGRSLHSVGMDWNDLAATLAAALVRPSTTFSFARIGRKAVRKEMAHLGRLLPHDSPDRAKLEVLRARLLVPSARLAAGELDWLDQLWRRAHATS